MRWGDSIPPTRPVHPKRCPLLSALDCLASTNWEVSARFAPSPTPRMDDRKAPWLPGLDGRKRMFVTSTSISRVSSLGDACCLSSSWPFSNRKVS